ncbi:hypothetical protein Tco_1558529, partial [Tanacetum coccineum]
IMSITKEQQQDLDDALVPREQRLSIGYYFLLQAQHQIQDEQEELLFYLETFRDMLQICPNLPRQKLVDPSFKEEILAFIRELGYSGNVKSLFDIKVDTLPQPWRTFETIINKCLSGKVTGLDLTLRLSRAQIL